MNHDNLEFHETISTLQVGSSAVEGGTTIAKVTSEAREANLEFVREQER